jgi:hypothetical protein
VARIAQVRQEFGKKLVAQGVRQSERHDVLAGRSTMKIVPNFVKRVYDIKRDIPKHVPGIGQLVRPALPINEGSAKPIL